MAPTRPRTARARLAHGGAALLVSALLGSAFAQVEIPALPVTPAPTPELVPTPAAPVSPDTATPAPVTPPPAPATPRPPARTAPLLIVVQATSPALVNGKKTTVPFTRVLTLPVDRVAQLRARGVITQSLDADLKAFLASLPRQGQDARFENLDGDWAVVQRNGLKVDEAQTRANVLAALQDPQGVKANVALTGQVAPKRTLDFFASRGITAHLGTGETNYYGSSAARMTNIHVGTRNFQDRLVEGGVVSFNQMIGPVSTRAGYVTGLVIAGERTADGVGGGICQVSTTVFRALYAAGLPIRERQNHSYQVHYYDPQGLDATIYQPKLDLKFANDTGGALWFQADWDDRESRLTINVFGKARDFTVEVGSPRTLSSTPAPADRLIRDASLRAGQRKQVDWAAPGAVIEVTRKFIRSGQTFKQDTLKSTYRPWPNIFLVGTRR
ncbi:hypothetical protein Dcar01_03093 [Deinococcus carri]|uniref:VanW n=1 Tax=Deinococcus carri TaxID=1211323 RepID=A0ABP9WCM4_9DEIO